MRNEVLGLAQNVQPSSENQDPQVLEGTRECNGRVFHSNQLKLCYSRGRKGARREGRVGELIELDYGDQVPFPSQAELDIFSDK